MSADIHKKSFLNVGQSAPQYKHTHDRNNRNRRKKGSQDMRDVARKTAGVINISARLKEGRYKRKKNTEHDCKMVSETHVFERSRGVRERFEFETIFPQGERVIHRDQARAILCSRRV